MVCVECRSVTEYGKSCSKCDGPLLRPPYKWSPPKKTNGRAWKRIAKGEWLWDRRRVRRSKYKGPETLTIFEYREVEKSPDEKPDCEHICCSTFWSSVRMERIPGSERELTNYKRLPDVDLGG